MIANGGNWGRGRRHEENKECRRNLVRKRKRDKSRAVTAFRSQLGFAWFVAWREKEKVTREQWRDVAVAEGTRADIEKDISHRSKPLQPSWLHASVTEANRVIYRSWEAAVYKNSYKNDKFTMRAGGERRCYLTRRPTIHDDTAARTITGTTRCPRTSSRRCLLASDHQTI